MRIGVVGINHKLADLKLREQLARACHQQFHPDALRAGAWIHGEHAFLLLSTCNRTEVYFSSEDLTGTHSYLLKILREAVAHDFEHKLYSYFGTDCFKHLAKVTAGLDSAIVGETEIQGQVKSAYEAAAHHHHLPPALHYLFQKSLKIGKNARSKLKLCRGLPDVEHAVLNAGIQILGDVWERSILFVGASEINQKIWTFFKHKGISGLTLCNRSRQRAEEPALRYKMSVLDWTDRNRWPYYDWVIVGTKSEEYVIDREQWPAGEESKGVHPVCRSVIDLSVPRNVNPRVGKIPEVTLFNVDQITSQLRRRTEKVQDAVLIAEMLVVAEARKHVDLFSRKERGRHLRLVGA